MIIEVVTATVVIERSAAAAKKGLDEILDFAFLDVVVTNGKTFEIANILTHKHVPFVLFRVPRKATCPVSYAASRSFQSRILRLRSRPRCRLS